jgi:hypothetical protein
LGRQISADELLSDRKAAAVARMALIQQMSEHQILAAIHQLENVAHERGDRVGNSVQARAALLLHSSLAAKHQRQSVPPPPPAA